MWTVVGLVKQIQNYQSRFVPRINVKKLVKTSISLVWALMNNNRIYPCTCVNAYRHI